MFNFGPRLELGSENGRGAVISNIAIILVGFGLIFLGYNTYTSQNQALENPVNVSATVTETDIDRQSSRRGGPDYQPEIIFEYSYEGQDYTSSNMYPGGQKPEDYNLESNAREVVQEYSQGSEITVSVPPSSPGEAFIHPSKTRDPLMFIAVGFSFVLAGSYKFMKGRYI